MPSRTECIFFYSPFAELFKKIRNVRASQLVFKGTVHIKIKNIFLLPVVAFIKYWCELPSFGETGIEIMAPP